MTLTMMAACLFAQESSASAALPDQTPIYENYLPVLALLILSIVIAVGMLAVSALLGPHKPSVRKLSVYESGMPPLSDSHPKFSVKFYIIAMLFILFDIEIVFMYPWAVIYKRWIATSSFILIEGLVFIAILLVGYVYAWKKGALDWE